MPVSPEKVATKHAIDETYTRYPFYGSRRITVELRQRRQIRFARETVQCYMREMGTLAPHWKCRCCQHLSRTEPESSHCREYKVYPYLLRNVKAVRANHDWGIDTLAPATQALVSHTFAYATTGCTLRLRSGQVLAAVPNWFSRYVVSWELDQTLEMPFVVATVQRAWSKPRQLSGTAIRAATSPALRDCLKRLRKSPNDCHDWPSTVLTDHFF